MLCGTQPPSWCGPLSSQSLQPGSQGTGAGKQGSVDEMAEGWQSLLPGSVFWLSQLLWQP